MKALVTGATGFLGGALARRLHAAGWQVTATGRNPEAGRALQAEGIDFRPADLSDTPAMCALCEGQQVVFHAGALSAPWGAYDDFFRANVLGSRAVREGCRRAGVPRLVAVSSPSVSFDFQSRRNIREDDPLPTRPVNAYVATKRQVEAETARDAAAGLPVVTLRPRALFGPGDTTILPRLIEANRRGGVPLIRGGRAVIDVTYLDNAVDAMLDAARAPDIALGRVYHISNGEPLALIDLLRALFVRLGEPLLARSVPWPVAHRIAHLLELRARVFGGEPRLTRYTVGVLACDQTLDLTAARRDLGYAPRVRVLDGLDAYAAHLQGRSP